VLPWSTRAPTTEEAGQEGGQRLGGLAELREHQDLLLLRRHRLDDLSQSRKLAASRLVPGALARPVRGVVADLLEPHQIGEDQAAPLDALGEPRDGTPQLVDGPLIERGLPARQEAERLHLGLVRQVGHDRAVGLEPTQEIGLDQATERRVALGRALGQPLGERGELAGGAQQSRVEEVEDRPQSPRRFSTGVPVSDASARFQRLDRPGLPGPGVLDRLRLVQNDQGPLPRPERVDARDRPVGRDDQIDAIEIGVRQVGQVARGHDRGVRDERPERGREALDLGLPVGEQRGRRHEEMGRPAPRAPLVQEQEAQDLDGLAEPHVVG
jgi:hypothetical protein